MDLNQQYCNDNLYSEIQVEAKTNKIGLWQNSSPLHPSDYRRLGIVSNPCQLGSNCGCSSKRKSECDTKCCQWIVGDGCKCRN